MLISIIYYLLFSAVFYLAYRFLYAPLSFHRSNRIAILLLPLAALLIAFIAPRFQIDSFFRPLAVLELPEIAIQGKRLQLDPSQSPQIPSLWSIIYYLGLLTSLIYFATGLLSLQKLLRQSERIYYRKYKLWFSTKISSAFCFGPYVFIPSKLRHSEELELIIEHEILHQKLGHSGDRVFYRIMSAILWFDPFLHAFAKELRQVHEFQVDEAILKDQNIEDYAQTLLSSMMGTDLKFPIKALSPSPFFNSSLIKSRITMMYQDQSRPWRKSLYSFLLPLMGAMVIMACSKSDTSTNSLVTGSLNSSGTPTLNHVVEGHLTNTETVDFDKVDELPVCAPCTKNSDAVQRQVCLFNLISEHIGSNFEYPELAKSEGMEGKIMLSFIIEADGSISTVEVLRGLAATGANQEMARDEAHKTAIALVASIPKFTSPAFKDEKAVRLKMVIPIALKLS